MSRYTHDVIVIGGGSGGLTATYGFAQLGMKTALIDRERLGGDCLHHGCVPSKTLLKIASVRQTLKETARFGLPDITVPPVDMSRVNDRIAQVVAEIEIHDSPERFRSLGADVLLGGARFISPHEVRVGDGDVVSAPAIVIATGSSPDTIAIPGMPESGFITNLDAFSLSDLPGRIVTIGAGPVGVELSQAFTRLGSRVTILDNASQVLPREDADMARFVHDRLVRDGATVRTGVTISRVERDGETRKVFLRTDHGEEVIETDEILLAAGRRGNTAGLGLEAAGVEVKDGFVPVNSRLQTSAKHILAIGDVNGRHLFTHVAGTEASVAVRRLGLHIGGSMNYRTVPWCTYTDPELASVGYNESRAAASGIAYTVVTEPFGLTDRAKAEGETAGLIKVLLDAKDRVIGTQIVGYHAGEMIVPALYAVGSRWKARALATPIFPYPIMGELHKRISMGHMAPRLFNHRVRGLLRFLFGYRGGAG